MSEIKLQFHFGIINDLYGSHCSVQERLIYPFLLKAYCAHYVHNLAFKLSFNFSLQFCLNKGMYRGTKIVSSYWIDEITKSNYRCGEEF